MSLHACLVVALALLAAARAQELAEFLSFGSGTADKKMPPSDDGFVGPVDLGFVWLFAGRNYTSVYFNVNGVVSLGHGIPAYTSTKLPRAINVGNPLFSPFWADADIREGPEAGDNNSNSVWYGRKTSASDLRLARADLINAGNSVPVGVTLDVYAITWNKVKRFQKDDQANSFQVVLVKQSNGVCYVMFIYRRIDWLIGKSSSTYPTFGFDAGDNSRKYEVPFSRSQYMNVWPLTQGDFNRSGWVWVVTHNISRLCDTESCDDDDAASTNMCTAEGCTCNPLCLYSFTDPEVPSFSIGVEMTDRLLSGTNLIRLSNRSSLNPGQVCNEYDQHYLMDDGVTWNSTYVGSDGGVRTSFNIFYATANDNVYIRTVQSWQNNLPQFLAGKTIKMDLVCNNGIKGCLIFKIAPAPNSTTICNCCMT